MKFVIEPHHLSRFHEVCDLIEFDSYALTGDIKLPARVQEAMQMQVEAERKKRAAILESEGIREADINVAEGKKRSKILASGESLHLFPNIKEFTSN